MSTPLKDSDFNITTTNSISLQDRVLINILKTNNHSSVSVLCMITTQPESFFTSGLTRLVQKGWVNKSGGAPIRYSIAPKTVKFLEAEAEQEKQNQQQELLKQKQEKLAQVQQTVKEYLLGKQWILLKSDYFKKSSVFTFNIFQLFKQVEQVDKTITLQEIYEILDSLFTTEFKENGFVLQVDPITWKKCVHIFLPDKLVDKAVNKNQEETVSVAVEDDPKKNWATITSVKEGPTMSVQQAVKECERFILFHELPFNEYHIQDHPEMVFRKRIIRAAINNLFEDSADDYDSDYN